MLNKRNLLITIFIIFSLVLLVGCKGGNDLESSQANLEVENEIKQEVKSHVEKTNKTLVNEEKLISYKDKEESVNVSKETVETDEEVKKEEVKKEEIKKEEVKKEEVKKEVKKEVVKKEEVKKEEPKKEKSNARKDPLNGEFMSKEVVNIRVGPGNGYDVFGPLEPGEKVTVIKTEVSEGKEWYAIFNFGEITGWVSANDLYNFDPNFKKNLENNVIEKNRAAGYSPNMIYFNGKAVPYKNGGVENGQAIIDTDGGFKYASTWGGREIFSGTDDRNTNFIGHNPGVFTGIEKAKKIVITDGLGNPFSYKVTTVLKADKDTYKTKEGEYKRDWLFGSFGGERITIQTCVLNENNNWLMEAKPE